MSLGVGGLFGSPLTLLSSVALLVFVALVSVRRRHPVVVAAASGGILLLPSFILRGTDVYVGSVALTTLGLAAVFLYAYALGSDSPWGFSLVGLIPLSVGVASATAAFNPLVGMVTVGPWLAGLLVASRRRVAAELEGLALELELERELFSAESVRYERARIARELHDIVAHSVSLIVVQAGAGERLAMVDPESAAESFDSISEAARQAEVEIKRLTELLGTSHSASPLTGLRIVGELVNRAQASGLRVLCHFRGQVDGLSEQSTEASYRLVQEALTNAMKHASGAPITVTVRGRDDDVQIEVVNGPARADRSGLEGLGGGHGLTGMRERIAGCGGTFAAGPTSERGWRVSASLPRHLRFGAVPVER
ncbi:sensor histidine kinase [Arthrobacter livingstonensis]|uniref:sensor histidine kinase n=1 Tax=Arthrobacter livingstonensis TaxID=670078 RepID=UPI001473DDC2|nr:histidine kinase [Arthrobacter livingstonensis]